MKLKGRKDLQQELNAINESFHSTKDEMNRLGATPQQIKSLYEKRNQLEANARELFADDLSKLNEGKSITIEGGTTSGSLGAIDQSKIQDLANKPLVGKEGMFKKLRKGLKTLPVVGTMIGGYSALQSGDASAAIPGLDSAESVGMSGEDEKIMLAEDQALRNYMKSPASQSIEKNMSPEQIQARRQALAKRSRGM